MSEIKDTVASGIVRRIDDLGRLVIPKEVRRCMGIHEGDPMNISVTEDGTMIIRKWKGGLERALLSFGKDLEDPENYDGLEEADIERLNAMIQGYCDTAIKQFRLRTGRAIDGEGNITSEDTND